MVDGHRLQRQRPETLFRSFPRPIDGSPTLPQFLFLVSFFLRNKGYPSLFLPFRVALPPPNPLASRIAPSALAGRAEERFRSLRGIRSIANRAVRLDLIPSPCCRITFRTGSRRPDSYGPACPAPRRAREPRSSYPARAVAAPAPALRASTTRWSRITPTGKRRFRIPLVSRCCGIKGICDKSSCEHTILGLFWVLQAQRGKLWVSYYVVLKWLFSLLIGIGK